jgi:predicted DCC family thiol-disulfide oxidoreductase YuxK
MTAESSTPKSPDPSRSPIVLYDGVCNLCDSTVRFVLLRDPEARIRFAPLQSRFAQALIMQGGIKIEAVPESIVFVDGEGAYQASTAVLRLVGYLRFPWNLLRVLLVVPRPLRDLVYRFVARRRYRWFGKAETCLLPDPKWRDRFLDFPEL